MGIHYREMLLAIPWKQGQASVIAIAASSFRLRGHSLQGIQIEIGIEIENHGDINCRDPDFDSDFDPEKTLS